MNPDIGIRAETDADAQSITEVTERAFATLEISDQTEALIIAALREAGALTLSLVAELEGRVIGHIAFSPVTVEDGTGGWFGLGPVSVLPKHQRRGVGAALVREGVSGLRRLRAAGCCVVGHPEYYGRFGFEHPAVLTYPGVPPEAFFALAFKGDTPKGEVAFHPAFQTQGKQG